MSSLLVKATAIDSRSVALASGRRFWGRIKCCWNWLGLCLRIASWLSRRRLARLQELALTSRFHTTSTRWFGSSNTFHLILSATHVTTFNFLEKLTYLQPAAAETSSRCYSPNLILLGRGCCFVRHHGLLGLGRTPSRVTEHGHVSGLAIVHDESLIMAGGRVGRGAPFGHDNNVLC